MQRQDSQENSLIKIDLKSRNDYNHRGFFILIGF